MKRINYVYLMSHLHSIQEDESDHCVDLSLYENCTLDATELCGTIEPIGNALRSALFVLLQNMKSYSFAFSNGWKSSQYSILREDCDAILDNFIIEAMTVSYSVFREDLNAYMKNWQEQWKNDTENTISLNSGKKRNMKQRPNIPKEGKRILSKWFEEHVSYPYPKMHEKENLSYQTGLSIKKVENWFINERSRKWHLYRKKF